MVRRVAANSLAGGDGVGVGAGAGESSLPEQLASKMAAATDINLTVVATLRLRVGANFKICLPIGV